MNDFANPKTPWARRMWDLGSFLALEELYDVGLWTDRHVLSKSAVDWLKRSLEVQLGQDVGFGSPELRRQLTECLRSDLTVRSDGRRRLREVIDLARPNYLDRWRQSAALEDPPGAERVARVVASHLLDSGHSLVGLRRWISERPELSAVDLLAEASLLAEKCPTIFKIWVPVIELPVPEQLADPLDNFTRLENLDYSVASKMKYEISKPVLGVFKYEVKARDAERAVDSVFEIVERMRARSRISGGKGRVVLGGKALVENEDRFIDLRFPNRGVAVKSLISEGQLLAVDSVSEHGADRLAIDDALELAAPLNSGALAPAISGAWAALEALLTDAKDEDQKEGKVAAATRAAHLTTCSWPRAELTALSYRIDGGKDAGHDLQERLNRALSNRDRSEIVANYLREQGGRLPLKRDWRLRSDVAALQRMNKLLDNPKNTLMQVSNYIEGSFRRMYRCRNVIVHGGSTRGDVLDATLRVASPLVGAALDRLTHARLVLECDPLVLATRANIAIQMASDREMGPHIVDLLGRV